MLRREGSMRLRDQRSDRGGRSAASTAPRPARARHGRRTHRRGPARHAGLLLAVLCPVLAAILLWSAPASSLSQRGHVFAFSFGEELPGPSAVAVAEHRSSEEGNVYVSLAGGERVERYKCTTVGCVLDPTFKPKIKGEPEYIAVDNSSTSPSKGDLYVGYEEERVEKFDPSKETKAGSGVFGEHIQTLKTFTVEKEKEEIGEIHGVAVDAGGTFYLYQAESIVKFNNEEKVKATEKVEPLFNCEPKPGFAVAPNGEAFYVGHGL